MADFHRANVLSACWNFIGVDRIMHAWNQRCACTCMCVSVGMDARSKAAASTILIDRSCVRPCAKFWSAARTFLRGPAGIPAKERWATRGAARSRTDVVCGRARGSDAAGSVSFVAADHPPVPFCTLF